MPSPEPKRVFQIALLYALITTTGIFLLVEVLHQIGIFS